MQLVFLISGFEEGRGFKETTQVHLYAIGEQLAKKSQNRAGKGCARIPRPHHTVLLFKHTQQEALPWGN